MSRSIQRIYIEDAVADHPRTAAICARLPRAERIPCRRYGEVFNRRSQNFRLQKKRPALILARKFDRYVHEAPAAYGIGAERNFYFSHMLNCIYDCRYCFLQGMFRSAHYVIFVNYEATQRAIEERIAAAPEASSCFFSGYDCDSLALEPVTGFAREFLPFFARQPRATLELRTKSVRIEALLETAPFANCVVAFSFTPEEVHGALEIGVPSVPRRLRAMRRLAERGWRLGLRFDPLIYSEGWEEQYRGLFDAVFDAVSPEHLHSVSLGPFRLPRGFYERLYRLYPDEPFIAGAPVGRGRMVSYPRQLEERMVAFCSEDLRRRVPPEIFFPCALPQADATPPGEAARV